jgi:large subunit ribosomal protein L24
MKIKSGDKVIVVTGKDRGKTGKVLKAIPNKDKVVVEGVGVVKRHQKARQSNQKGQIVEKPSAIHVSNVMLVDPKGGKRTRVGYKKVDGKNVRVAKRSGTTVSK